MTFRGVNKLVTTILSASVAGVLVAGLTACGGGSTAQEPQAPAPSASIATSEPAVDVPAPPVMPDQAKQPTQAGAEAFLQYWWDVHVYSYQSGDTDLLASISDLTLCKFCVSSIEFIGANTVKGERQVGGRILVTRVDLLKVWDVPSFEFSVELTQEAGAIEDASGSKVSEVEQAQNIPSNAVLKWVEDRWVALHIGAEAA